MSSRIFLFLYQSKSEKKKNKKKLLIKETKLRYNYVIQVYRSGHQSEQYIIIIKLYKKGSLKERGNSDLGGI